MHAYMHYITLHYIALHYITLHYIALHYITLHYLTYIILFILIYNYMHIYIYKQLVSELVGLISPCFPLNPLNPFPDSTPARWPTPRSGRVVSGRCRRSGPVRCIWWATTPRSWPWCSGGSEISSEIGWDGSNFQAFEQISLYFFGIFGVPNFDTHIDRIGWENLQEPQWNSW